MAMISTRRRSEAETQRHKPAATILALLFAPPQQSHCTPDAVTSLQTNHNVIFLASNAVQLSHD